METFEIKGEFIALHQLLKACDWVSSGGEAKAVIQSGEVLVNGEIETQRGKKLRWGDEVALGDNKLKVA